MHTFRLLAGTHTQNTNGKSTKYRRGDIVECEKDLAKQFGRDKFERVPAGTKPQSEEAEEADLLEGMTAKQLLAWAEEREIDTQGETKKEGLLRILRGSLVEA